MVGDTLVLVFETQNPRRSAFSNKFLKLEIINGQYNAKLYHASEEKVTVEHWDGSTSIRKAPMSETKKTKLSLNSQSFEEGETIMGEIEISLVFQRGRSTKVKEKMTGTFRAIISSPVYDCSEVAMLSNQNR